jgi:hypothetical protein
MRQTAKDLERPPSNNSKGDVSQLRYMKPMLTHHEHVGERLLDWTTGGISYD